MRITLQRTIGTPPAWRGFRFQAHPMIQTGDDMRTILTAHSNAVVLRTV